MEYLGQVDYDWDLKRISPSVEPTVRKILTVLEKKYGAPQCGRNRATFISKTCVFKVPLSDYGFGDNTWEAKTKNERCARTKIKFVSGIPIAVMELLRHPTNEERWKLPDWTSMIDCCQVGYDKKGRLKAYDFGPH